MAQEEGTTPTTQEDGGEIQCAITEKHDGEVEVEDPVVKTWDGYHDKTVKVLPQFLRDELPIPVPADVATTTKEPSSSSTTAKTSGFQKRSRLMKVENTTNTDVKMCNQVIRGLECTHGSACTFSHDVATFLNTRPPDIPGPCPVLTATGRCAMGYSCRWVGSHLEPTIFNPNNITSREDDAAWREPKRLVEVKASLQRKRYVYEKTHKREGYVEGRRPFSLQGKVYVAPLTTVGNLPFRRLLVKLGADVTCGEMAMAYQIIRGSSQEWALLKKHPSERHFGVQIAGCTADELAKAAEIISRETDADFIDINMGCPIDLVTSHGSGSALLRRPGRIEQIVEAVVKAAPDVPLGLKLRTGWDEDKLVAHEIITRMKPYADKLLYMTVHGRTRAQRYTKTANWSYIENECARAAATVGIPLMGNGDVMHWRNYHDAVTPIEQGGMMDPQAPVVGALVGRGALIKPWLCTEIKQQKEWDISAEERFGLLRDFCNYGLEHWGSDSRGVETTRRYALEWLSFAHRYVPVGLCEQGYRQHMNDRAPFYVGRSELETLMGSPNSKHWERLVEMILGPSPGGFQFVPKHKANAW